MDGGMEGFGLRLVGTMVMRDFHYWHWLAKGRTLLTENVIIVVDDVIHKENGDLRICRL